jgi:hypothetical protein
MYKIINQGTRSFIVKAKDVLKGGQKGTKSEEKIITASPSVVEVTDELGRFLSTYAGILVVEAPANEPKIKKGK